MFKVSVDQSSIKSIEDNVRKAFDKVIANKQLLKDLGDTIVKDIKGVNRTGISPKTGTKHPELTSVTKEIRGVLSQTNSTDPSYKRDKSNITFSGQLLNSIQSTSNGPGEIEIKATGTHKPPVDNRGKATGDVVSNESIISDLSSRGFYVMGVRQTLVPRLRKMVISYIRRASNVLFQLEND